MSEFQLWRAIGLFGVCLLCVYGVIWMLLLTPAVRLFVDRPNARKMHQRIVPRAGGVCIIATFLLFVLPWHFLPASPFATLPVHLLYAVLWASISILVAGIPDDTVYFQIRNSHKFLLEIGIAIVIVYAMDVRFTTVHLLGWTVDLGRLGGVLSVIWIVGVANAVNIIDGADCLAGGITLSGFASIGVLAAVAGDPGVAVLCIVCCGLIGGFMLHNISPARVFLGDSGSLFLGMLLGILSIHVVTMQGARLPVVAAPLVVGFPILDVFLAMFRRYVKAYLGGEPWHRAFRFMTVADNEHIHHRLMFRGLTHMQTSLTLAVFSNTICASALVVSFGAKVWGFLVLAYLLGVTLWLVHRLDFFERPITFIAARKLKRSGEQNPPCVAVVNADDVLRHALTSYHQGILRFHFVGHSDMHFLRSEFAAVLINNISTDRLDKDIALSWSIVKDRNCPVIVAADEFQASPESLRAYSGGNSHFMRKPLYIPQLVERVYLMVRNTRRVDAFSAAFGGKTSVWKTVDV